MSKKKLFVAVLMFVIVAFPLNLLFEVTAIPASDNYKPVNSDYMLTVSVNLDNLSIYMVNATTGNYTSTNLTSKIVPSDLTSSPGILLFNFPSISILSGSSPKSLMNSYFSSNTLNSLLNPSFPVITSFSSHGYAKIDQLYSPHVSPTPILEKISSDSSISSISAVKSISAIYAHKYSILQLDHANASFSASDFNNQIGSQFTQSKTFTPNAVYQTTPNIFYANYTSTNFTGTLDPNYQGYENELNATLTTSVIRNQNLNPDYAKNTKQQLFYAGFTNFTDQAILTPVKDFAIAALSNNGTYVTSSQLKVVYNNITSILGNTQISEALRNHLLSSIPKNSTVPSTLATVFLSFFGFKFFNFLEVVPVSATGCWYCGMAKMFDITVNGVGHSFTSDPNNILTIVTSNSLNDIKIGGVSKGGSILDYMSSTSSFNPLSFLTDSSGLLFNGLLTTNAGGSSFVSNMLNSFFGGSGNIANDFNPLNFFGQIASTFLKPIISFVIIGIVLLIVVVLIVALIPKVVGGIHLKK